MPASANEADMIFTKCRRVTGSDHSLAPVGNSRSNHWRNSGLAANSSRLRQYWRPVSGSGHFGGIVLLIDDTWSRFAWIQPSTHAWLFSRIQAAPLRTSVARLNQ